MSTGISTAAAATVADYGALATAFSDPAGGGGQATLTADIAQGSAAGLRLAAGGTLTLDLSGFDLTTGSIVLGAGSTLTITDTSAGTPGTLTASYDRTPSGSRQDSVIETNDATLMIEGRAQVSTDDANITFITVAGIGATTGTGTLLIRGDAVVTSDCLGPAIAVGGASVNDATLPVSSATIGGNAQVTATSQYGGGIGGRPGQDGGNLTITDNAVVEATSTQGAGIGGGVNGGNGGTVVIDGDAQVTAISQASASGGSLALGAGIGGGLAAQRDAGARFEGGNGGDVTIGGNAVVTATSERLGAGIGAGDNGMRGGSLHVLDNATVTATSGLAGAGIGGGTGDGAWPEDGNGADVILDGGTTTAINAAQPYQTSAVGVGTGGTDFGSLEINSPAVLVIPAGAVLRIPDGITVPGDGQLRGDGTVVNDGAVQLATDQVDWPVLRLDPHDYLTTFDANGGTGTAAVRTFATTFTAGARELPPPPTRPGYEFLGCADSPLGLVAAASGRAVAPRAVVDFTEDTLLTGDRTLYAQWAASTTTAAATAAAPAIGQDLAVTVTVAAVDPVAGVPVGTVQLFVDGSPVGSPVPVDAAGAATLTYPAVTAGTHTLRVDFTPTDVVWGSSASAPLQFILTEPVVPAAPIPAAPAPAAPGPPADAAPPTTVLTVPLATTGSPEPMPWLGAAALLIVAGAWLARLARHRWTARTR
ncbi:Ig-like domain repeat protein [Cellulomonas denverensis]|uniref:Bacterial Ig-like domain-containing protein n=1 Tax=Cellulomonas denverensis TaxID=264297 RepID=A0A7X6QZH2_9CELL|nr:hypothetical protein [Cellulomonas denverensis]GIG23812.1 hypothetical protein Cde04nite_00560 [Cellulomonas denverensis]